jgi:Protein of unknown function (DUF1353)
MSKMYGFQNLSLEVKTRDGLDDVLLEALRFVDAQGRHWRAPIGSTTDGLSTPKIIRCLPGYDATGDDWWSGVLHDAAYRNTLEIETDGNWKKADLTQADSDALILAAMVTQRVGWWRRHIIYWALRLFGSLAFEKDRQKTAAGLC